MTVKHLVLLLSLLFPGLFFVIPVSATVADHIVISQVQIDGIDGSGGTAEDFIELYNPTGRAVDISGWKLRKRTRSGSESSIRVFTDAQIIPAYGYFLWANSGNSFALSLSADQSSTATIASNNSIALFDSEGNLIDAMAWGEGHESPFVEGLTAENPAGAQSLERKPGLSSGNGEDTNDNSQDFFLQNSPHPRDSSSPAESPAESGPLVDGETGEEGAEANQAESEEAEESGEEQEQMPAPAVGGFSLELSEVLPNPDGTDSGNEYPVLQ